MDAPASTVNNPATDLSKMLVIRDRLLELLFAWSSIIAGSAVT